MDEPRDIGSSESKSVRDTDAGRAQDLDSLQPLVDIIGHPSLVRRFRYRTGPPAIGDALVLDPGLTVGWAVLRHDGEVVFGQFPWHSSVPETAYDRVYVERSPFAARRNFDPWPIRYEGALRAAIYPQEPFFVEPTVLKVASKWVYFERRKPGGPFIGQHAKDACLHMVHLLVTGKLK